MSHSEEVERVRQQIMRFRELLNIMRLKLEDGERAYEQLFSNRSPGEMKTVKEKDLQLLVAQDIIDDTSALQKAVMRARFDAHELERAFEELYNIIATE